MPIVWRVTQADSAQLLDGGDNVKRGGRWNSPGRPVLYAAENLALAALECFANLPLQARRQLPEMAAVGIEIPDETALAIARDELAAKCKDGKGEQWCRMIGDSWLKEMRHLILVAPSVIVPRENNIMLNPAHPAMSNVAVAVVEPYMFDPRLIYGEE
jgi:RES domain-containing protein